MNPRWVRNNKASVAIILYIVLEYPLMTIP